MTRTRILAVRCRRHSEEQVERTLHRADPPP